MRKEPDAALRARYGLAMSHSLRTIAVAAALIAATVWVAHADGPIGVNAAVVPQGTGTPPDGSPEPLVIGQPVVFNERIMTKLAGQTQILFRDESTLTVGPGSDLVIDQFVYDPNADTGKLAMSATLGVFRFIGGRVSKRDNPVTLTTPSGTVGIRGGIFVARIAANGGLTAVFVYGKELTVTGRNGAVSHVRRPGFAVSIDRAGDSPSAPFAAPRELLATLFGQFDGVATSRIAAAVSDARIAGDPLFARLAGTNPTGRPQLLADRGLGGFVAAHAMLGSTPALANLNLGAVVSQGRGRLLRLIQAFCQSSPRC